MPDKSYVSMEQHQCPMCLTVFDTGNILLDRRLRESFERKTVTGHSPCSDCKAKIDEGYIVLVGVQNEETGTRNHLQPKDAKRSGSMAWVRSQVWDRIFNTPAPERHMAFVSEAVIEKLAEMDRLSRS